MNNKQELLEQKLSDNGYITLVESLKNAVLALIDAFSIDELVEIYKGLLDKYLTKYPEQVFGQTMIVDEEKEINYNDGENDHTRSEGIKTKPMDASMKVGKTVKKVSHKTTGTKRSNARDPLVEANYKKRVAVHASTLREHATWTLGEDTVEKLIKASVVDYTEKYNKNFGTSFAVHYAQPRKNWTAWYLAQTVKQGV